MKIMKNHLTVPVLLAVPFLLVVAASAIAGKIVEPDEFLN